MRAFILLATVAVVSAGYTGPTNQAGVDLIKSFEGWEQNFYTDAVGIKTIGYGHACHVSKTACTVPINGKYTPPLTPQQGNELLASDLGQRGYESCVANAVTYPLLNANQYSALVSFCFNLGCDNLKSSTLLKKLNGADVAGAAEEFGKWTKAGGKELAGLVRRRKAEKDLFCSNGVCGISGSSSSSSSSTTACSGTITASSLVVRSQPNTSGAATGSYSQGNAVTILGRSDGTVVSGNKNWFKVTAGYISAYYVTITSSNGQAWCSKN